MRRHFGSGVPFCLFVTPPPPPGELSPRTRRCVFLGFPTNAPGWLFYHLGSRRVLSSQDITFDESVCFYHLHPNRNSCVPLPPLTLVSETPLVAPLPSQGPAPLVVSQVDPSPLVEPPVAEHSGAVGGGAFGGADSGGAGSWGADFPLGTGGTGGAGAGGPGTSRQEALSPWQLREWAVQWGSPGGGASRLRAGGAGTAGAGGAGTAGARGSDTGGTGVAARGSGGASPGGASAGVPGVGHAGGTGTGGTGAVGGTGGAGFGGASAGVPGVFRAGGTGTRGTGAAGGTGGAGPVGASAVVPRAGGTGGADTRGATRGTGVGGASRQESLSPQQLREWTVRWGGSGGGAGGTGSGGAVTTGAGGSGGATTQPQQSVLRHLLSIPPAAIEFSVAGTTPPLLFPPTDQSQPQLLLGSPLLAPTPNTEVTKFFSEHREPETRPSTPVRGRPVVRTNFDKVPPLGANIVDGMWIFRVKRPSGSPPAFKARYVARGFTQHDYEQHSLDFSTAFLQGSLHDETWLRWVVFCGYPVEPPPTSLRSPPGAPRVARHTEDDTCGSWVCSFLC
ncbi:unnamed protein product [Closterium sp. NIES-53]